MSQFRQQVASFWGDRNPRERRILGAGAIALVLVLYYVLLIDPALGGRAMLQKQLPSLRQQTAEVQSMTREATELGGKTRPPPPLLSKDMIDSALSSRGLKSQSVVVTGEQVKVQLNGASFAGITDWLADAQRTARLAVTDANIEAQEKQDTVNATITLRQQRTAQ
ncbi:type II secretion system protein M [Noviherbaspirillum sp. 17J57-3]|uniref:Type II secretion system protein M n=2 Tax=Noviherbaspirillum galbum TaxID=2709383 RepID=A0A6B3SSC9_9BURK|nr:type II secretion system protein M [Noviherbaspirillum galbum]